MFGATHAVYTAIQKEHTVISRIRRLLVGGATGNGDNIGFYVDRYNRLVADFGTALGKRYVNLKPATGVRTLTASASLTEADSGKTIVFDSTTSIIAGLPKASECAGCEFLFLWKQLTSASTGHGASPNALDYVGGGVTALTVVVNKDIYSAQNTNAVTDRLRIKSNGTTGYDVIDFVGTFSKEP